MQCNGNSVIIQDCKNIERLRSWHIELVMGNGYDTAFGYHKIHLGAQICAKKRR